MSASLAEAIYVLGAGGHSRVVVDTLIASGIHITGILDANAETSQPIRGIPILGGDRYLDQVSIEKTYLVNGLGANPQVSKRQNIFMAMKQRGFRFKSIQHPSAIVSPAVDIQEGAQIMAGVVIQPGVTLGENVVINTRASIDHDCQIGTHAFISPGVILCGNVKIGTSAFIGAGVAIAPNTQIGYNAIVGAGTVVRQSVPDHWIVAGNPAIQIGVNNP